ncbi:hypothetical protein [Acinetobacter guerrae]|uniref:hypothetical protein n=1 Tax=Acinetobacter guerrae TaxID=1843371 RepID=UPI00125F8F1F|nr:hypothetical protein [Acinetobacter guerrae]
MINLITSVEAFQALQAGKTVLCRHITGEFEALDQFPATVFGMQNHEFCIQIEMLELAGITFTKPLTLDEYRDDQEVFVISTYAPSIYIVNFKTAALVESINSGFVQRDAENAKLQLKALSKALGRELSDNFSVTRLGNEPKKTKRKKEPGAKITAIDDEVNETLEKAEQEIVATGITITEQGPVNIVEENLGVGQQVEQYWDHQEILNDLIERASKAQTPAEANALFKYTKGWTQEQTAPLHAAVSRRLAELPQPVVKDPPSLLVRIQSAPDFAALDELEIEVSTRDPFIQKALFDEIKKRRAQIKQTEPDFVEDLS